MAKEQLENTLESLLQLVANELVERVSSGRAEHQDISNAIKLLKDNHVNVDVKQGDPLDILSEKLPFDSLQDFSDDETPLRIVK